MTNPKVIIFILLLLTGPMASAGLEVKTDFYFPMSLKDYSAVLMKKSMQGMESAQLPTYEFKKPFKTSIINTVMDINYNAQVQAVESKHGSFKFSLDIGSSRISSEKVITDDMIEKYIGGILVQVFVRGQCNGISLQNNSPLKLEGVFDLESVNSQLSAKVKSLQVVGLSAWDVSIGECTGMKGYEKIIDAELKKFLKDPAFLAGLFTEHLQNKLNNLVNELTAKVLAERQIKVTDALEVMLSPLGIIFNSENGQMLVHGELVSHILSQDSNAVIEVPAPVTNEDISTFAQSGLVISQEYVTALSNAFYKSGFYSKNIKSDTIGGFKSLMGSRFLQFFLWADLMQFKLGTIFDFRTFATAAPKIQNLGTSGGAAWFNLEGPVRANMMAPSPNGFVPYVNFQSATTTQAWIGVFKGKALVGFNKPVLKVKSSWDQSWMKKFGLSKGPLMSLSTIVSQLTKSIKKQRFLFELPSFEVGEEKLMQPAEFKSGAKWLQLVYKPTTGN